MTAYISDLPTTWLSLKLGDVVAYGKTEKAEPEEIAPDTWVLELEDLEKDTTKVLQRLTFADRQSKSTKNKFNAGDVLYGKLRPYLNKVTFADMPGVCTTEIVPIKPNEAVHGRYLFHWLRHPAFLTYVTEVSHGVNMPRLGTDAGRDAPFVLAPKAEQKRIADKLDTVLTRVDAVNTRLARVAPLLKRFRQSVLAAATSGRLTADLNGGAVSAPVELGDLCNVYGGKRLPKGFQLSDFDTGFPYVRVTDFDSFSVKTDQLKYVPEEAAREISRYIINASDVYISIAGSIGLVGQVPVAIDGANLTENAARIVPNKKLRPVFLMYQLASPQLQEQMHEKKIATTQDKLGLFRIKSLNIWLPGLDEQTEIVRRVETLFAFADRLEARLVQAQTAATRLTPALLAKAFRGELVPQDPNDEPAAELLRRLQAERATAPKASTGRGRKAAVQV